MEAGAEDVGNGEEEGGCCICRGDRGWREEGKKGEGEVVAFLIPPTFMLSGLVLERKELESLDISKQGVGGFPYYGGFGETSSTEGRGRSLGFHLVC